MGLVTKSNAIAVTSNKTCFFIILFRVNEQFGVGQVFSFDSPLRPTCPTTSAS